MAEGASSSAGQSAGTSPSGAAGSVSNPVQSVAEGATQKADASDESGNAEKATDTTEKTTAKAEPAEKAEAPEKKEATEETTEEIEEVKKHRHADKLAKIFPDRKFEKDEDYDNALDEHVKDLEDYKERATNVNKKLIAGFEAEPAVGDAIRDWLNGASFRAAVARHFSPEDFTPQEGDEDHDAWNENKTKREEDLAKKKQLREERENNLKVSEGTMQNFAQENNLDEDAADKFYMRILDMVTAINSGLVSKETLLAMKRAFDYEQEVAKEKEKAAAAERNKTIVAQKEAPEKKGDGLPRPAKTSSEPEVVQSAPTYMDNLLERVNRKKVI